MCIYMYICICLFWHPIFWINVILELMGKQKTKNPALMLVRKACSWMPQFQTCMECVSRFQHPMVPLLVVSNMF